MSQNICKFENHKTRQNKTREIGLPSYYLKWLVDKPNFSKVQVGKFFRIKTDETSLTVGAKKSTGKK